MKIEVVQAGPGGCERVELDLPAGASVGDALRESGLGAGQELPGGITAVAVFGVVVDLQAALREGDRVELLRPLLIDPKQARRRRAKAARATC